MVDFATKKSLQVGQVGELYVRSASVMIGYLRNSEATAEALDEYGWLHTGDMGYFDSDGYFFIVDRIKEMIKCNSYQVSPSELEQVISCVSGVEEVAVVAMPHNVSGEVPVALVVKSAKSSVTSDQISQKVSGKEFQDFMKGAILRDAMGACRNFEQLQAFEGHHFREQPSQEPRRKDIKETSPGHDLPTKTDPHRGRHGFAHVKHV